MPGRGVLVGLGVLLGLGVTSGLGVPPRLGVLLGLSVLLGLGVLPKTAGPLGMSWLQSCTGLTKGTRFVAASWSRGRAINLQVAWHIALLLQHLVFAPMSTGLRWSQRDSYCRNITDVAMRPLVDPTQQFVDFDCLFPINQCYITLIVQVRGGQPYGMVCRYGLSGSVALGPTLLHFLLAFCTGMQHGNFKIELS